MTVCIEDPAVSSALRDYYESHRAENSHYDDWLSAIDEPIVVRRNRLKPDTLSTLFGDSTVLSQSRLETYVKCHFSYFCDYVLHLQEQKKTEFSTADIGTFVHALLRSFLLEYMQADDRTKYQEEATLRTMVDGYIGDYLERICHIRRGSGDSARTVHLMDRLETASVTAIRFLMEELESSDFVPRDFELKIGERSQIPMLSLPLDENGRQTVSLSGTIDRIDTYEHDGETYLRVIDYKTGSKEFKLDDVRRGINMQMLLYLDTVLKNGGSRYPGKRSPAGVLYAKISPDEKTFDAPPTDEDIEKGAKNTLVRSGLFLSDEDVLNAMDHGLSGRFIPVKKKTDGYSKEQMLVTADEFAGVMSEVESAVCQIVREMRSGDADAIPLGLRDPDAEGNPCEYCKMKPVCRGTVKAE